MNTLKWLLPRLPLPMLALAASYGVYQFALLFVPQWVAIVQAAAFELTYIGLATIETHGPLQRRKAIAISLSAVVVSVLYNSLAGFFHRNGLGSLNIAGEIALAILHGAPLAIVAYLVADLLLHNEAELELQQVEPEPATMEAPAPSVQISPANTQPLLPSLTAGLPINASPMQEEASAFWGDVEKLQAPANDVQTRDMAAIFEKARAFMPEDVKEPEWLAWWLYEKEDMSQAEVARIMSKSVSTISRQCARVSEVMAA